MLFYNFKAIKRIMVSTLLSNEFYNCTICGTVVGVVIFAQATSLVANYCIHVKMLLL